MLQESIEALCKDKPQFRGHDGLTISMMKCITHGAHCAIRMLSTTGDVSALWHDLRNGPRHCFGNHQNCNSAFCKHVNENPERHYIYIIVCNICSLSHTDSLPFDTFPLDFTDDVESCGDRLVSKTAQLVSNKTTIISENFMSIRCKMDGGKYFKSVIRVFPTLIYGNCT